MNKLYRVQEFAELAGVTVRALHHYDRLGLLKPERTEAGYRLYSLGDFERLEQIVALKFLGIPLKQIRTLFHREAPVWPAALRRQRIVLEEKRRLLDSAINAIREAEQTMRPGKRPDSAVLKKIIEVIEMQDNLDWSKKYYSEEAQAKIEERKQLWSPENQERWSKEWLDLFRDVEAALGEDPASAKARALAARWKKLVEGFTGGDPQITAGLGKMYQDRGNWPATMQQRMQPFGNKKVWEFIQKAFAAGKA
ncbi:MAG TPA: MerR family transcriptional regulator [Candidatus Cybelea sp.]|nr:MerR family transcriptional regulator [Candidatus Cybelea sp.]